MIYNIFNSIIGTGIFNSEVISANSEIILSVVVIIGFIAFLIGIPLVVTGNKRGLLILLTFVLISIVPTVLLFK